MAIIGGNDQKWFLNFLTWTLVTDKRPSYNSKILDTSFSLPRASVLSEAKETDIVRLEIFLNF